MGGQDIDNKLIEQMYELWRRDDANAGIQPEPWKNNNKVKAYFKN